MAYDPRRFEITLGGEGGTMYLGNTFRDWLAYPQSEREAALDGAIAHVLEDKPDLSFEQAQALLLPLVRNLCDMALASRDIDEALRPASAPLGGPLSIHLAIDRPHSISIVQEKQLERWGRSFEGLMQKAIENLESRSPCRFERTDGGFFVSRFEDFYDASRLLVPRLFEQLELAGDPVAVAISRSCLVVTGSEETDHLIAMAQFVDQAMQDETRPISYAPLVWRDGAWSPFEPQSPALAEVRTPTVKQRLWDYSKQADALNEERSSREVFIAKADARFEGDELQTWCTWTEGVPTLLPRTDYIGITDLKLHIFRRWEDVEAVCGPFEVEAGHWPIRYFVDRWPAAASLARLKAEFRPPSWGPD